jgi:transposase InsO family protein
MKEEGLKAKGKAKSRYSSYKGSVGRIAPDYIKRNFKAKKPLNKLVSDITEFHIGEKKVYLSPLIDLYNGEVISWKVGLKPNMKMVLQMVTDIYQDLKKSRPIIHTDQGLHYQNPQWQLLLKRCGCTQSMSRKGNCLDNAPAESFFSRLKTEFSNGSDYKDARYFMKKLDEWIYWYNNERIKESLSGMSPVKYRKAKNPPTLDNVQV